MWMTEIITIGFIPNDCHSQEVACGDAQYSGTIERSFRIKEGWIVGIDCDVKIRFTGELVIPNSPFLKRLSDNLSTWSLVLSPNDLYNGLTLLRNGQERFSSKFSLVESSGGVFSNEGGLYNGLYYIRRFEEGDDGVVLKELVCLKVF